MFPSHPLPPLFLSKIQDGFHYPDWKEATYNNPDIIILAKKKTVYIVNVGYTFDTRIKDQERTKLEKYTHLNYELRNVWKGEATKVFILPVIIGALKMGRKCYGLGSPEDRITRYVKNPEEGFGLVTCH